MILLGLYNYCWFFLVLITLNWHIKSLGQPCHCLFYLQSSSNLSTFLHSSVLLYLTAQIYFYYIILFSSLLSLFLSLKSCNCSLICPSCLERTPDRYPAPVRLSFFLACQSQRYSTCPLSLFLPVFHPRLQAELFKLPTWFCPCTTTKQPPPPFGPFPTVAPCYLLDRIDLPDSDLAPLRSIINMPTKRVYVYMLIIVVKNVNRLSSAV